MSVKVSASYNGGVDLDGLFLFFFFRTFVGILSFLRRRFRIFLRTLGLTNSINRRYVSLLKEEVRRTGIIFMNLSIIFRPFMDTGRTFAITMRVSFFITIDTCATRTFFDDQRIRTIRRLICRYVRFFVRAIFFLREGRTSNVPFLRRNACLFNDYVIYDSNDFRNDRALGSVFFLNRIFRFFQTL